MNGCSYAEDDDLPSDVDMYGLEVEEEEPEDFDDEEDDHKKKGRKKRRRRMNKVSTAVRSVCVRRWRSRPICVPPTGPIERTTVD